MKKLIMILVMMFTMSSFAQVTVDSLAIINPTNGYRLKTITKPVKLEKTLDSLNKIYKTNKFIVVSYLSDGRAYQCRVVKKFEAIREEKIL